MTRPRLSRLVLASCAAWPMVTRAQTASSPPTRLSGLTVVAPAKEPPKVVSTFPEAGKPVQPGALIVKVTFDQKMDPAGWDYAKGQNRYPSCLDRPRLLADEKTFILLCTAGPDQRFSVTLNATTAGGFVNMAGQRATPGEVDFSTVDGAALSTIGEAMKAAGLKPDQGPVMEGLPGPPLASTARAANAN